MEHRQLGRTGVSVSKLCLGAMDIQETLGALTDLVHQGKVRYIGHSTFPASRIVEPQWAARDHHLQRFVAEQPPYSILVCAIEADVLPTCQYRNDARGTRRMPINVPQGVLAQV
jgi:aryl-alcohol dehydrogenase-like predicted oxidoreductase